MPTATIKAQPGDLQFDTATTAVLVIDMQNDFGSEGGMFQRAGIDISMIQAVVAPTARVIAAARACGMPIGPMAAPAAFWFATPGTPVSC